MTNAAPVISRLTHPYFRANAWLVQQGDRGILIDTASNSSADGRQLVAWLRSQVQHLDAVLLSHGHPDIWLGVRELHAAFPETPILAPSEAILDDILAMGALLEGYGMIEPDLSPSRYDYRSVIRVPRQLPSLPGASLRLRLTDRPSEHAHIALFEVPELGALFVSDLAYNHVHAWAGTGVDRAALVQWVAILDGLIAELGPKPLRLFPGHGAETDTNVLYTQRAWLQALMAAVDSGEGDEAVRDRMVAQFPAHAGVEFQLAMTVQNRAALAP